VVASHLPVSTDSNWLIFFPCILSDWYHEWVLRSKQFSITWNAFLLIRLLLGLIHGENQISIISTSTYILSQQLSPSGYNGSFAAPSPNSGNTHLILNDIEDCRHAGSMSRKIEAVLMAWNLPTQQSWMGWDILIAKDSRLDSDAKRVTSHWSCRSSRIPRSDYVLSSPVPMRSFESRSINIPWIL
jgi:hypothetical protein